jgi:hypothetical protein
MRIELTDDEVTTMMVALDSYGTDMREMWMESRDDGDLTEAGSAEWCWQKLNEAQQQFRNSIVDAIGEGESPSTPIDPFSLPTWTE